MNFRVLAASAQAPQRSNGNDFPPHNAPRPEGAGGDALVVVVVGGGFLKEDDGGGCRSAWGLLCFKKKHPFSACFSSDICLFY